jgi:hypothetical protein
MTLRQWMNDLWRKTHGWKIVKLTEVDGFTGQTYQIRTWVSPDRSRLMGRFVP